MMENTTTTAHTRNGTHMLQRKQQTTRRSHRFVRDPHTDGISKSLIHKVPEMMRMQTSPHLFPPPRVTAPATHFIHVFSPSHLRRSRESGSNSTTTTRRGGQSSKQRTTLGMDGEVTPPALPITAMTGMGCQLMHRCLLIHLSHHP